MRRLLFRPRPCSLWWECPRRQSGARRKDCPQVLRQSGRWAEQLELIELEYYARTELKGVQFEWKSLTPDIMDDLGRVSDDRPKSVVVVSYEVKVSYNGEEKTYTFSSSLNKL